MVIAFVLIKVKRGGEVSVPEKIREMDGVIDVAQLYGEYDVIAKVEKTNMEALQNFLVKELRKVDGVDKTSTLITGKV
jgi:DNA-binding Lrp family transcriptional regulator